MIHPETRFQNQIADDAQAAFLASHPHRKSDGLDNDHAAIEWRHGYIVGRQACRNIRQEDGS